MFKERKMFNQTKEFMMSCFGDMKRRSGEPMYVHSLELAYLLKAQGYDIRYQIVALLHDVLEDTDTTIDDIETALPFVDDDIKQGIYSCMKFEKETDQSMLDRASTNKYGLIIKPCDRYQNAITIWQDMNSQEFISGFFEKTLNIYIPWIEKNCSDSPFLAPLVIQLRKLWVMMIPKAKDWCIEKCGQENIDKLYDQGKYSLIDSRQERADYIRYTWNHKLAFLECERRFLGRNTIRGYLHDVDKLIMYFTPIKLKTAQKIHNKISRHHNRARNYYDHRNMVIDFACARMTKLDKPLDAKETVDVYYGGTKDKFIPILKEWNINHEK